MNELISQHLDLWTSAIASKSRAGRGNKSPSPAGEGRGEGNPTSTRNGKVTAYGIKKLRELILEFAVRGKLVAQDSSDEPAGVLLEKIAAEKERLVKEGKIKKQNLLPEINDEEKPCDLPENWKWTKLGNISFINPRNEADDKFIASFVPMSFITTLHTGEHEQETREWKEIKNGYTHFANGDIGVAKITPCFENSKAVVFSNLSNNIGAGTTELHIARPYGDTLCARYILIYLKSPEFLIVGESKMTGTAGQKRIPKEFFAENPLPLPPLAEQHRIVAKVDELMALCDQLEQQQTNNIAAHQTLVQTLLDTLTKAADAAAFEQAWSRIANHFDTLFTTEPSINQLKQTLLQLAVMGKLVPQDISEEPCQKLLEKIIVEKEVRVANGQAKKAKNFVEIIENNVPFSLPNCWCWVKFGSVLEVTSSKRIHANDYMPEGIPFFRSKEIGELKNRQPISTEIFISREKYQQLENLPGSPKKGDLMLTSVGTIGNSWICDGREFYYKDGNITKVGVSSHINMVYVQIFIDSPFFKSSIQDTVSGTAYNALTIIKLNNLSFPLPPLAEQHRIVTKVDELMSLCDTLKARITAAQTTQIHLADTIVEQAVA